MLTTRAQDFTNGVAACCVEALQQVPSTAASQLEDQAQLGHLRRRILVASVQVDLGSQATPLRLHYESHIMDCRNAPICVNVAVL